MPLNSELGASGVPGAGSITTAMLADNSVTFAKMQDITVDTLIGRATAGTGDPESIALTAAGRALIDDADASAQRTTLGLGTLATQNGTFSGTTSGTNTGDQIVPAVARVSTQFDKTASTAFTNITGLSLSLLAATAYEFEAVIHLAADVVGGCKITIAGTATATSIIWQFETFDDDSGATAQAGREVALGASTSGAVVGITAVAWVIKGCILVNGAGTLTVQLAQAVASGTSSVLVNSTLKVNRI